ncbi:hypothetical protein EDD85DRAFT_961229 [Armillaria nabsnona]|nr:hypothetical protein EDD85DRAFT_961229 [Armillaria nabsnona]
MARATHQDMLLAGENNLMHLEGYRSIRDDGWLPVINSHVVLAACEDYQYAKGKKVIKEDGTEGYIGIFTDSLVRVLRSGDYQKDTTYADLVHCVDQVSYQTPVVAGKYQNARHWYQD